MVKVVRFVRGDSIYSSCYGAYICFRSSRMASDILSFIVLGYVSILSWFILSFLFEFDRRDVRIVVDDTIISVGSKSKVVYVAFEPLLRRILYI
ncbi:MAG: hypothetical protein QW534_04160, partial [Candidatus Methanomethylicia archaeon]